MSRSETSETSTRCPINKSEEILENLLKKNPKSSQTLEVAPAKMNINGTCDVEVEVFKILIKVQVTKQPILIVVYGHTYRSLGCSYIAARGANPSQ